MKSDKTSLQNYLTSLCSSWLFLACLMDKVSAAWVNFTLSTFWRYFCCKIVLQSKYSVKHKCSNLKTHSPPHTINLRRLQALQLSWPVQHPGSHQPPSPLPSSRSDQRGTGSVRIKPYSRLKKCNNNNNKKNSSCNPMFTSTFSYITLQVVGLLSLLHFDVIRQDGVVMKLLPIV